MSDIRDSKPSGKLAWFAFHPADFAGETQDLTQNEVGAYILLACYYAQMGWLPDDDTKLARIARCRSVKEWRAMRPSIEPLFDANGRLATEVNKAHAMREERAASGRKGGLAKASKHVAPLDVRQLAKLYQPHPDSHPLPNKEGLPASKYTNGTGYGLEGSATYQEEEDTYARESGHRGSTNGETE